jgi:hypothetical protein
MPRGSVPAISWRPWNMERDLESIDVRQAAMDRYNQDVQRSLKQSVWDTGCQSWYKNASGKITNNWPHSTISYWWQTRHVDFSAFNLRARTGVLAHAA